MYAAVHLSVSTASWHAHCAALVYNGLCSITQLQIYISGGSVTLVLPRWRIEVVRLPPTSRLWAELVLSFTQLLACRYFKFLHYHLQLRTEPDLHIWRPISHPDFFRLYLARSFVLFRVSFCHLRWKSQLRCVRWNVVSLPCQAASFVRIASIYFIVGDVIIPRNVQNYHSSDYKTCHQLPWLVWLVSLSRSSVSSELLKHQQSVPSGKFRSAGKLSEHALDFPARLDIKQIWCESYKLTYLALRSSGPWQDSGQQEFAICFCL